MDVSRYSTIPNGQQTDAEFQSATGSLSRQLEQLVSLVRRQYLIIIVVAALTTALGVVYLVTTPPTYTANAKLIIDSS